MSQSRYIGVIRSTKLVEVIKREEYTMEPGDLVFESPSRDTMHYRIGEAMRENGIKTVDLRLVKHKMNTKQLTYLANLKNYTNVFITYHVYTDGTSIYALLYRDKNVVETVYVSDRLYREVALIKDCLTRVVLRAKEILKTEIIAYSPIQIPGVNTIITPPWEFTVQQIRIGRLCRGESTNYRFKYIEL